MEQLHLEAEAEEAHHPLAVGAVEEPTRLVLVQEEAEEEAEEQHPLEEAVGEEQRCLVLVLVAAAAELHLLAEAEVQGLLVVVAEAAPCFLAEGEAAAAGRLRQGEGEVVLVW